MTTIPDDQLLSNAETLKGKVVLITGAANGIGQATAVAFAQYGAKVIIGDIDLAAAKHTVRECLRAGGTIGGEGMAHQCDVTSWDDQVSLFKAGYEKYGRIDYVIANAGVGNGGDGALALSGPQRDIPPRPSTSVINVNVVGVIYTVRLAQHYMMKNKTKEPKALIFIGSMGGSNGIPKAEIYSASKHAIIGLARSLYDDMKTYNIRVAVVSPWFTDTAILPKASRFILAGLPLTPVSRIVSAIIHASTDAEWSTSGATYALPDDKEVFRIERHELAVGAYKLFHDRLKGVIAVQSTLAHYRAVISDLLILALPVLNVIVFALPIFAYWFFFVR